MNPLEVISLASFGVVLGLLLWRTFGLQESDDPSAGVTALEPPPTGVESRADLAQ